MAAGCYDRWTQTPTAEILVAFPCDLYLEHSLGHHKPGMYASDLLRLQDFCERYGKLAISALKPFHVTR